MAIPPKTGSGAAGRLAFSLLGLIGIGLVTAGCCHPHVTAVALSPWNRDEPEGIPFYLPKPLLIVAKNFNYVEEAKVGLTDSAPIPENFDDQSKYADVNSRSTFLRDQTTAPLPHDGSQGAYSPTQNPNPCCKSKASKPYLYSSNIDGTKKDAGGAPVTPGRFDKECFYTYHIVFIPDMAQKYGLRVRGGVGEIRAALNIVNGWQFTGLGPFYMKDSSTAQNILSSGIAANLALSGVADVAQSLTNLQNKAKTGGGGAFNEQVRTIDNRLKAMGAYASPPLCLPDYAEIYIYEPHVTPEGQMEWSLLSHVQFNRQDYSAGNAFEQEIIRYGTVPPPAPAHYGSPPPTGALGTPVVPTEQIMPLAPILGTPVVPRNGTPDKGEEKKEEKKSPQGAARPTLDAETGRALAARVLGVSSDHIRTVSAMTPELSQAQVTTPACAAPGATYESWAQYYAPPSPGGVTNLTLNQSPAVTVRARRRGTQVVEVPVDRGSSDYTNVAAPPINGDVTNLVVNQQPPAPLNHRRGRPWFGRLWDRLCGRSAQVESNVTNVQAE